MITEKKEKQILMMSFFSGLLFAIAEFIFAIYSHSQSALTDAVYDASELVFIALLLFLTPLFHKPVSEKHPYGYFQLESIFVIIKGVMMLSMTMGVSAEVLDSALSGGNPINNAQVSLFSFCLGAASIIIFLLMKRLNRNLFLAHHHRRASGMETGYCIQSGHVPGLFPVPLSGKNSPGIYHPIF